MQQSTYDGYVANMGYSTNKVTIESTQAKQQWHKITTERGKKVLES